MIINENNKNKIMGGKIKRGFNQTPKELKEKIYNDLQSYNAEINPKKTVETPNYNPQNLKRTMENMRKLNK